MERRRTILWVQAASLARLLGALAFAAIAFQSTGVAATFYVLAAITDLVDGYLARRFDATTYFGKVLDLVSDKSLTVVSVLYAAARDIPLFPLALIGTREIVVLGARLIQIDGVSLLPSSRLFGGVMASLLWTATFLLTVTPIADVPSPAFAYAYWTVGLVFTGNLVIRLIVSRRRITDALREVGPVDPPSQ